MRLPLGAGPWQAEIAAKRGFLREEEASFGSEMAADTRGAS